MKLTQIELTGFKSIRDFSIDLAPLNVFIGANGVGKSNLVSFFKLLNDMTAEHLQASVAKSGWAEALLHYGSKQTPQLTAKLHFSSDTDEKTYYLKLESTADDTLFFADEAVEFSKTGETSKKRVSLGKGHQESKLLDPEIQSHTAAHFVNKLLQHCRVYHFHDTSETAYVKKYGNINNNRYLMANADNLAAFLFHLKHKHNAHYRQIRHIIRMVAPLFDDFVLAPSPSNEQTILLEWKETGSDKYFNASYLSDGTLRMMCLTTLLLQPQLPELIVIDEPELGLHPYAINLLATMLTRASKHAQIIISTQSSNLVDQFSPEEVIVVERDKQGASTFKRLESAK